MRSKVFPPFLFLLLWVAGPLARGAAPPKETDYRGVQTEKEFRIERLRNDEIHAVKMALGLRNPENRKAELYLRLAELYLEAYQADFLLEGRIHEKNLKGDPAARFIRGRSSEDLRNGIGAAETILKLKVNPGKLDQIYYFLGYNYGEYGDSEKSRQYYLKLAREFPNSGYSGDGIRALADEAFAKGRFTEAEQQYEAALKKNVDVAQKARIHHRLAWCYYRQNRIPDAIRSMKKAIEIARTGGGGEKLLSIREDGLRDLAIYYAEQGRVDEAIDYFKENAGESDQLPRVLEKLGKEFERSGQGEKAKQVYSVILGMEPKDDTLFRVSAKMVDLDLLKENFLGAAERLRNLRVPTATDPDTSAALASLRRLVRSTAVSNQERFRKKQDKKEGQRHLEAADLFYSLYLDKFISNNKDARAELNEVRMFEAEVKRDLGQPGAAAELYKKVIQDRDEKYAKEAAQLWVGSLASELKKRASDLKSPGEAPSGIEKDFVEASDLLEKSIPQSVESREARLRSAQILAGYASEKPEALKRASALARDASSTPQGVLAARLWLQLDPSRATIETLLGSAALREADRGMRGDLHKDLEAAIQALRVSRISSFEKVGDFLKAGKAYEEYALSAKTEKEAESAYVGALGSYAQAGNSEEVNRVMKQWRDRFPRSVQLERSVKAEATLFFIRGQFTDSAELFYGIGKLLQDRASFLTSAALFSGGIQFKKAIQVYRQSLLVSPTDEQRAEVLKLMALAAQDVQDDLLLLQSWKQCAEIASSFQAECLCQLGNFYLNRKDDLQAKARFQMAAGLHSGPSSRSPFIAYAQFRIAQLLEKEMKSTPLEFPETRLLKGFEARIAELKPVSAAYVKAVELGGPWGIAATERLGDLSAAVSDEVARVLRDPRAMPQLKEALMPAAEALSRSAREQAEGAFRAALKSEVLSPALPVLQDRLVDAKVAGMQRAQGARLGVKLIGLDPNGGKQGREEALKRVRVELIKNRDDALAWIDYGNLLWGLGKPGLSKVAYERSLALRVRAADAQNNLAVVLVSDLGPENWYAANEAVALWKAALRREARNSAALFNLGHLFNYYRLFSLAHPYLQKVSKKVSIPEVHDALAVAYWGMGRKTEGEIHSKKAEQLGMESKRFTRNYREASEMAGPDCIAKLGEIPGVVDLKGFEKIAVGRLKQRCER
jgi:tetratricopeptide (TPR) repeat protein